jgi:hypothetical protein
VAGSIFAVVATLHWAIDRTSGVFCASDFYCDSRDSHSSRVIIDDGSVKVAGVTGRGI